MSQRQGLGEHLVRLFARPFLRRGYAGLPSAWRGAVVGFSLGALFLLLWLVGAFSVHEEATLDVRYFLRHRLAPRSEPAPVTVVAVDERAIDAFGSWPWPRVVQAEVMRALLAEEPAAVGLTMLYSSASEDFRGDQRFAQSLQSDIPVILAASTSGNQERIPPLNFLAPNVYIGHVNMVPDRDGIVRRFALETPYSGGRLRALSWEMAHRLKEEEPLRPLAASSTDGLVRINFRPDGSLSMMRKASLAPTVSIVDVVEGRVGDAIRGRPVIVGVTNNDGELTAFRSLGSISPAYLHAAALTMILTDDYVREQPVWYGALLLLIGGLVVGTVSFMLRPFPATVFFFTAFAGFLTFAMWRFIASNDWIVVLPFMSLLIATYISGLWHAHSVSERKAQAMRETFRKYVAPEVVDTLLNQPGVAEMEGGRRPVTVLFADLRGFTAFTEANEPEEVVRLLNRYLEIMSESVHLYGGMLDKFVGDGVMALFGAPLPMDNHAEAAMGAGVHMLRGVEKRARGKESMALTVGIGIHSGEAVVGSIGSAARLEYTAIGDVVNVASRLQELARPGMIVLSKNTFELLSDVVRKTGKRLEPVRVRGRVEPVEAYEFRVHPIPQRGDGS